MASYVLTTNWETFSDAVRGAIKNAYDAAAVKGASFSDQTTEKTLANLASFINTIVIGAVTHISKTVSPGAPGTQPVTYSPVSDNVDYYDSVTVNPIPSNYLIPSGNLNISDGSVTARDVSDKATVTLVPGDLGSSNIRSGATILGVQGSDTVVDTKLEEGETAVTAAYMLSGRTAYINGNKITGTMVDRGAITTTLTATTPSVSKSTGRYTSGTISIDGSLFPAELIEYDTGGNFVASYTFSGLKTKYNSVIAYCAGAIGNVSGNTNRLIRLAYISPYEGDYNNFCASFHYNAQEYTISSASSTSLTSSNVSFRATSCKISLPTNHRFKWQYRLIFFKV